MAHINDFLSHIDFEVMHEFCMANGKTVRYAKGDYAVTEFSFEDEYIIDFTQSFLFGKPSKISILAGCDSVVLQISSRHANSS